MEQELTNTQLFMIEKIGEEITKVKKMIKKASDSDKPKLRIRLKQLEEQLENAKKPVHRTEKEKEMIDNMAKNVLKNTQIEKGLKIEGDRSDKKLTSEEEFAYKLGEYLENNKNQIVELQKVIAVRKEVYETLLAHKPVSEETAYAQNLNQIKEDIVKLTVAVKSMQDRVEVGEDFIKEIRDNYQFVSKLNRFLGNPLGLSDYGEYAEELKNKVEGELK